VLISDAEQATLLRLGATVVASPELTKFSLPSGHLRILGHLPSAPGLAIVGARTADAYGRELAARIATSAARRGVSVISGGAFGIDAAAHEAALASGGHTTVVLGSGLDLPAPATHRGLFARVVAAGGAVVTPFACGQAATRWTFPRRNPWIAGLARAVVVVQANTQSGSLQTARAALAAGIPVFAVPGPLDSPLHSGCHLLVEAGARLLTGVEGWAGAVPLPVDDRAPSEGLALWRAAGVEARPLAELAQAAGLSPVEALGLATTLELDGWLRAAPGGRFARARPEEV
jgi:DNA processing protein